MQKCVKKLWLIVTDRQKISLTPYTGVYDFFFKLNLLIEVLVHYSGHKVRFDNIQAMRWIRNHLMIEQFSTIWISNYFAIQIPIVITLSDRI